MTTFDLAVSLILESEGVFGNHPADPGRKTKFGISEGAGTLEEAKRRGLVPRNREIEFLSESEARTIYRVMYWDEVKGDLLPAPLALVSFDMAVNPGPYFAITTLQKALGVKIDGIIGAQTLAAARKAPAGVLDRMLADRARYYFNQTIKVPAKLVFLEGWLVRCFRTARQAATL